MLLMPVLLAIVITTVQNSTFELVNNNKVPLILYNKDTGQVSTEFIRALDKIGMFELKNLDSSQNEKDIVSRMHAKDALVAIIIPENYTDQTLSKAKNITKEALKNVNIAEDSVTNVSINEVPLTMYYHPVLQQSFRNSINGALRSALQLVQSKYIVRQLYTTVNEQTIPDSLENQITANQLPVNEIPVSRTAAAIFQMQRNITFLHGRFSPCSLSLYHLGAALYGKNKAVVLSGCAHYPQTSW